MKQENIFLLMQIELMSKNMVDFFQIFRPSKKKCDKNALSGI